jgi:hypothetical protein
MAKRASGRREAAGSVEGEPMTARTKEQFIEEIVDLFLAVPEAEREDVISKVKYNPYFCFACGYGSKQHHCVPDAGRSPHASELHPPHSDITFQRRDDCGR